jgi:AAA+ ATPase superfamily predicted ATPase
MREFKKQASAHFSDPYMEKLETDSWFDLFDYISRLLEEGKIIVLDEFSYAVKAEPKILSYIRRAWDRSMSKKKVMLVISGSLLGLMHSIMTSGSPLYGRRTRDMLLGELKPWHAPDFFKDRQYGIMAYMLAGGVPSYLQVSARYTSVRELVEREFLDQNGYFYREPYFLLSEELREPRNYFSILSAIASGNSDASSIANYVGMKTRKIFPYLEQMSILGLVERRVPLMAREKR